MPDPGPFGETSFEASERAMTGALLVKRSFGGCVESVLTLRTQRFFELFFVDDGLAADRPFADADFSFEPDFFAATVNAS